MFEKIKENLPTITIIAILLGYFDIYNYYDKFGINIYNYIDPSEIIFSFSSLMIFVVSLALNVLFFRIIDSIVPPKEEVYSKKTLNQIRGAFYFRLFIISILLLVYVGITIISSEEITERFLFFLFLMLFYMLSITYDFKAANKRLKAAANKDSIFTVPVGVINKKINYEILFTLILTLIIVRTH